MSITQGSENIASPLQQSALFKKGLCDYVVNVASGCLHGCTFCYVPSTPVIRTRQNHLKEKGVIDPQMDWGKYLFLRENLPEKLENTLERKRVWHETPAGKGVVLLCSGTDPYQNKKTADLTRMAVETLLKYNKRVRILTRGLLWLNDLDILAHPNVTVGMSLPYLNDTLSRQIEPASPPPSLRLKALLEGHKAGCRLYIASAPTPPQMILEDFIFYLDKILQIEPEVIFWEPINARGTNGKRMLAAGLDFIEPIMNKKAWAKYFIDQWGAFEKAAQSIGCLERLHIWPDQELAGFVDSKILEYWWYKPTIERWPGYEAQEISNNFRPSITIK
ncbi:radical SAM protein [Nostoc sp. UHCC 0926]|uniref:SPL family radical SAM protein n=1 Tax=unclassified Nostoc TaxID=2593658 RepID=UPI00235EA6F6|nr:radical SAM protein [Nostoc sp. UHCC 0926]WDD30388.1 radical SAM protein [Nostoc sp. UHCC 0926]